MSIDPRVSEFLPEDFQARLEGIRDRRDLSFSSLLSVEAVKEADLQLLFDLTAVLLDFVRSPQKKLPLLKGKSVINLFFEPSTRTHITFELGGKQLGADTINFSGGASSVQKGETLGDTAKTLNAMSPDLVICRNGEAGAPYLLARELDCPIINAGDGWHEHPTQALFDLFTISRHFENWRKVKVLIVGDIRHSRVAGSLMRLLKSQGVQFGLAAPATLLPEAVDQFTSAIHHDLDAVIADYDIIYVLRLQEERGAGFYVPTLREYSQRYGINKRRMALAKKRALVMHPGPVRRELDIMTDVLESEASLVDQQVTNGFALRMALMWLLLTPLSTIRA